MELLTKEVDMGLLAELEVAKAEVVRLEGEIATLPSVIAGKAEAEMVEIYHRIRQYFGDNVPPQDLPNG